MESYDYDFWPEAGYEYYYPEWDDMEAQQFGFAGPYYGYRRPYYGYRYPFGGPFYGGPFFRRRRRFFFWPFIFFPFF